MQVFNQRLAVLLSFIFLGFIQPLYADTTQAVNYLSNQQQTNGSYIGQNAISTDFQSTSETIRAFNFIGESDQAGILTGKTFLAANTLNNTENLSRQIVLAAQASENVQSLVSELLQHQNTDGGFGDFEGYDSTVLDTAFALEAIAESGLQPASVADAVSFLLNTQKNDGSWADGVNESSVYLSALAMRALWHYRVAFSGVSSSLKSAQSFLLQERNSATGLWAEQHESALALIAIVPNVSEFSQVESTLNDLRNQQQADGSWDSDTYVTALALRALASQPTPLPPAITTGNIAGTVLNNITKQPIANASVVIDSLSLTITTDVSGAFILENLDPAPYSLRVNATGYSQINFNSVPVIVGVDNNLGDILLTPLPTTGVLQGQVSDSATGQPLQGVVLSVTGTSTASTNTSIDGAYSIVGLNPGDVVITVVKDGYLPVNANANINAGGTLVFNPALTPTSSDTEPLPGTATTGVLRGTVTDASTGTPIQSAAVRVRDAATNAFLAFKSTAADGSYEIIDLEPANIIIQVNKSGFLQASANGTVSAGNALVFSPGLVAEGGDPDSGTGDIGEEPLPGTPTTGVLQGVVTDLETSLPLVGATVTVAGSITASTITAADGSYSIAGINPGDISIIASSTGYVNVGASGTVVAGNAINFNPQLPPEGFVGGDTGKIIGRVVEVGDQSPIRTVLVRVLGSAGETTTSTQSDGGFELADLPPDNYTISFEKAGYVTQEFNAVITSGGTVDFQTIELSLALMEVAVFGQLNDVDTGEPIEGAVLSVSGTAFNAETDEQGNYRLEGLDIGSKTLIFTATGYNSQTLIFNFPQGGEFEINRSLGLTANSGVDITFLNTDQANYAAYAPALIQASINNNGSPVEAMAVFTLFNDQDELITEYMGVLPGTTENLITLPASTVTSVAANFNTANLPPGDYKLIGRIVVGNQSIGPATVILDERVTTFTIEQTRRVSELSIDILPEFSAVGVQENINLLATVLNRSNVEASVNINYRLIDPDGVTVKTGSGNTPLPVDNDIVVFNLDSFVQEFLTSGEYTLEINSSGSLIPEAINVDAISVAPGLRIDPNQSVTPGTVTPDENQRVRINIRLEGKEVQ